MVEYLLRGYSIEEIAEKLGVSKNTVWRRIKVVEVQGLIDEARKEMFRQVGYRLVSAFYDSVKYLHTVVCGESPGDALRLKAAQIIVSNNVFHTLALEDLRREVETLKALRPASPHELKGEYHDRDTASFGENGTAAQGNSAVVIEEAPPGQ